jgi:hypothetical protein
MHLPNVTDPAFWKELTMGKALEIDMENDPVVEEDPQVGIEQFVDDSDLPSEAVIAHVHESDSPMAVQSTAEGDLVSAAHAESLEEDAMEESSGSEEATVTAGG